MAGDSAAKARSMKLLVGLGNPGSGHARQRHNVGFMAVERIAERHGLGPWRRKFAGLSCEGAIAGHRVVLLKPQTYMNDSGRSVGEAKRYLRIAEREVCVLHDELDLAPGKLRVKVGGGNAGHNGLRSLTQHIGNAYARVRIGIGHPGAKELVQGYVLSDFSAADRAWLGPLLDAIADATGWLAGGDLPRFLAEIARTERGKPPATPAAGADPPRQRRKSLGVLADGLKTWLKGRA